MKGLHSQEQENIATDVSLTVRALTEDFKSTLENVQGRFHIILLLHKTSCKIILQTTAQADTALFIRTDRWSETRKKKEDKK